jgi:hypothetical protein
MGVVADMTPKTGDKIAVWFSCGAASAIAAKLIIENYSPQCEVVICNNPIMEEHEDNQRFLRDVSLWLKWPIQHVVSGKYPSQSCKEVWAKRRYMAGVAGAPCTLELKKGTRQQWEVENKPNWTVLGFTAEEQRRADRFRLTERETLLTPLIDAGYTKEDCFRILSEVGIKLPEVYSRGMPNANCIGCVKSNSPTYWNLIRKEFPEIFEDRAKQSREIGARLVKVKGERIFLDELDPNAVGRPLKDYHIECGIFCEEDDG